MIEVDDVKLEVGDKIDVFFDGKCSPSRHSVLVFRDAVPITQVSKAYLRKWKKAINDDFKESLLDGHVSYCSGPQRFWDWNCDLFIFGAFQCDHETTKEPIMFARRGFGDWYGVNYNYMLDLKGDVVKENLKIWQECAKEAGQTLKWNKKLHRIEYYKNGVMVEVC